MGPIQERAALRAAAGQIEGIAELNVVGDGTSVSSAEANQLSPPHNDAEYLSLRYLRGMAVYNVPIPREDHILHLISPLRGEKIP